MIAFVVVLFVELARVFCELPPGNLTDFSVCKVSHLGVEYRGSIGKTESNVRCQTWTSNEPHKVADALTDAKFPLGSKRASKNYCRNPGEWQTSEVRTRHLKRGRFQTGKRRGLGVTP